MYARIDEPLYDPFIQFFKLYGIYRVLDTLAHEYHVSRVTIYKVLRQIRAKQLVPLKSVNKRYRSLKYGLKRLAKVEAELEKKLQSQAKRYNKVYPGEMMHVDTVRLPMLTGELRKTHTREYLFVGVDDYSRELYAVIMPDKTSISSQAFLSQMLDECPYAIECVYSDNGTEYKERADEHLFTLTCMVNNIVQRFTKVKHPQTNGKAERVIRTIIEMWHQKEHFISREQRRLSLNRFINYYNTVKPHSALDGKTPYETLYDYFYQDTQTYMVINSKSVNNA